VCFRVGKAPTRHILGAASLISFVMVAEVRSINSFWTRTNSSGMIEDEELSFREWNCFEHFGTSTGRKQYLCGLVEKAQRGESGAGRNRTFVQPNLVDHIPSIGVVEAKENL
jgi:hypothetical protein